jgi:methylthioribose-1-phosphate isomerase
MNVKGKPYTTIWLSSPGRVSVIDQRRLPHEFVIAELTSCSDAALAIRDMTVRGAGLIGVTAAWGMYLAAFRAGGPGFTDELRETALTLKKTRPTAKNLEWAVDRMLNAILASDRGIKAAESEAASIAAEDASFCRRIGEHGLPLIRAIAERKGGKPVNILTHCNAGWLAFTDYGSATAPIYAAFDAGIPLHVWVDETRPRNQGANSQPGSSACTGSLSPDRGQRRGHLMQRGLVDLVITGADRVTEPETQRTRSAPTSRPSLLGITASPFTRLSPPRPSTGRSRTEYAISR